MPVFRFPPNCISRKFMYPNLFLINLGTHFLEVANRSISVRWSPVPSHVYSHLPHNFRSSYEYLIQCQAKILCLIRSSFPSLLIMLTIKPWSCAIFWACSSSPISLEHMFFLLRCTFLLPNLETSPWKARCFTLIRNNKHVHNIKPLKGWLVNLQRHEMWHKCEVAFEEVTWPLNTMRFPIASRIVVISTSFDFSYLMPPHTPSLIFF
jgi:hypothetical protein